MNSLTCSPTLASSTARGPRYRCGGIADRQAEIGAAEAGAALLRGYQPSLIPGIVQTVPYARELLTIPGARPHWRHAGAHQGADHGTGQTAGAAISARSAHADRAWRRRSPCISGPWTPC
ncbi:MAG: Scr1 family TA system antitoxin-like transcriptional regulator [Pseudonocardiaceae bacterium]